MPLQFEIQRALLAELNDPERKAAMIYAAVLKGKTLIYGIWDKNRMQLKELCAIGEGGWSANCEGRIHRVATSELAGLRVLDAGNFCNHDEFAGFVRDGSTISYEVPDDGEGQETFSEYLRRVGADHKESGKEFTAEDYVNAADRIDAAVEALRNLPTVPNDSDVESIVNNLLDRE